MLPRTWQYDRATAIQISPTQRKRLEPTLVNTPALFSRNVGGRHLYQPSCDDSSGSQARHSRVIAFINNRLNLSRAEQQFGSETISHIMNTSSTQPRFVPLVSPSGPLNLQDFGDELRYASGEPSIYGDSSDSSDTSPPMDFNISLQESNLINQPILGATSTDCSGPRKVVGIRAQFLMTRRVSTDGEKMVVTGSLPQLTAWGAGCQMVRANGTWQCDLMLIGSASASTVIEFLYKYVAINPATNAHLWESRISRCRLQLDKLLDHVFPLDRVSAENGKVKIVFQANGIPQNAPQIDLLLSGSCKMLGEWDLKKAKMLNKAPIGTWHTTVYAKAGSSFLYAYLLVRNSTALFEAGSRVPVGENSNSAMLWSSGVGRVLPMKNINAVVQLLDEWDQAASMLQDQSPAACKTSAARRQLQPPAGKAVAGSSDAKSMEEMHRRLHCKVCWEAEVAMVLLPCGHSATCWRCGALVHRCPLCRSNISQRVRMYI